MTDNPTLVSLNDACRLAASVGRQSTVGAVLAISGGNPLGEKRVALVRTEVISGSMTASPSAAQAQRKDEGVILWPSISKILKTAIRLPNVARRIHHSASRRSAPRRAMSDLRRRPSKRPLRSHGK